MVTPRKQVIELSPLDQIRQTEAENIQGHTRYKEILSRSDDRARSIVAQAHNKAEVLRRKGKLCMSTAVCDAVNIIIGLEDSVKDE